jgi:hypothetical protein
LICCNKIKSGSLILLVTVLFLFTGKVIAQDQSNNSVNNQIWIDFNSSYKISDRLEYNGTIGTKDVFPHSWYKIYTKSDISLKLPKFIFKKFDYDEKVYAGMQLNYIFYSEQPNVFELSPYQGYSIKLPNREHLILQHKLELAERFQWTLPDWSYSFGLKLSYEGIITWKLYGNVLKLAKRIDLSCSFKFWWNLIASDVYNNVARITPGMGYRINDKWQTAFLVGWDYTRDASIDSFNNNSIIYHFRVYYKILFSNNKP